MEENSDILAKKDSDLTQTDTVTMKIETGDHPPIKLRPYRTPLNTRKIIDKAVDEMLEANIIQRSRSSWAFPVIIVEKKDGSSRFCIDYRKLNKITRPIAINLPLIDDIINRLSGAKYFTSLDLRSGYWQVKVDEGSQDRTAFTCHKGLFSFKSMPFGLCNAPSVFTELMTEVLDGLDDFATSYLDDVLIWSNSLSEHLSHIRQVFDRFRQHNLKLKLKKCNFLQEETTHLGFVISKQGVKPDENKVKAIRSLPPPTNVREVRGFIGSVSWYRRYIPNFSKIAEPLIRLTRKHARFKWDQECQAAFEYLKESLTIIPLLAFPDCSLPYRVYTDSSADTVGAMLSQEQEEIDEEGNSTGRMVEKPIYFLSHKLSPTQCRYSTIERECYAIYYALQKLHTYLHNAKFEIFCDHQPLKYLLESPMMNKRVQMWALTIQGYNATINFISGKENSVADLLSRIPNQKEEERGQETLSEQEIEPEVSDKSYEIGVINSNAVDLNQFASCKFKEDDLIDKPDSLGLDMIVEQAKDPEICLIKSKLESDQTSNSLLKKYIILDQVLYYISKVDEDPVIRLYVPSHLTEKVMAETHNIIHMGFDKTFDAIRKHYFWPNLYKQVYDYVSKCVACQSRNMQKIKSPIKEVDTPPFPFAKIAIDLVGPLPKTLSSNMYILTAIDWYSGYLEAWPLPDKKADAIAHIFLEEIVTRYGCPVSVVTDSGSEFVNSTLGNLFKKLNISHRRTNVYSPWENRVERVHRSLMDILSKKVQENTHTWDLYLNQALAAIRFSENESTKHSPFFYLFQRDPIIPVHNLLQPRRRYYGEDIIERGLEQAHKAFLFMHRRRKQAHRRQAKYADRKRKHINFEVGQPVYIKKHKRENKLDSKWQPYYRIMKRTGDKTWELRDQLTGKIIKSSTDNMRLANIDKWEIPEAQGQRKTRKANLVVPPESDSSSATSDSESEPPQEKLIKRYRRERSDSDEEEEIPLAEVARRLREREARLAQENKNSDSENQLKSENSDLSVKLEHSSSDSEKETASESNKSMNQGNQSSASSALSSEEADNSIMDIDQVCKFRQKNYKRRKSPPKADKIKNLLTSIVDAL